MTEDLIPKICDFGESKTILRTYVTNTKVDILGTVPWSAPEYLDVRRIKERNEKGDVYSFGVILWELVTRQVPWNQYTLPSDILQCVIGGETLQIPENCPKKLAELMQQCWKNGFFLCFSTYNIDPNERPSFNQN